ncbi:MAG: cation diffusion facilitator family transporter [Alistipes sp.]|nr:cation diffusion facilitator family transporter [Alistipes sp.]
MKRTDHNGNKHDHSHGLAHHVPAGEYLNRAFTIGIALNLVFVAVEFIAGILVGSVALISDAGHNLSDVISLALAMFAFRLARQKPSEKYTYGRKKSTVIVSLANACILLVAVGFIIYESILKLIAPEPVQGGIVAWVAGVGIIINAFTAWLFLRHKDTDINVKGAYLHMAADALVSVGVLVSGIVISLTGWYPLDPIIGIVIAVVIFFSTWNLLTASIRLSLDGVPPDIDPDLVARTIREADDAILDVHHIHIWPLSTTETALTAHIAVRDATQAARIRHKVKCVLKEIGIAHATLETESPGDCDGQCPCNP